MPFQEVKRPGRGVDHPPSSSAEVKERVELYIYSTSETLQSVRGGNVTLPLTHTDSLDTYASSTTGNLQELQQV